MSRGVQPDPISIVGGWACPDNVKLVVRKPDGSTSIQTRRSRWSFFLQGADDADRRHLARMKEVVGISVESGWTRVDCPTRWARQNLLWSLENRGVETYEGDVGLLRRLLSDEPTILISDAFRVVWLDIEVDSRAHFADQRAGKARILCWTLEDATGWQAGHLLEADTDDAERALLTALFDTLATRDVVSAWSGTWGDETYDFKVIRERLTRLGFQWRGGDVPWHRWNWLDGLDTFDKYHQQSESGEERESLKLDDVARTILGVGKHDFDAAKTWAAWAAGGSERERLFTYCQHDTHLAAGIEAKTGYIALHLAVCRVTRCLPDNRSLRAIEQGDGFLLALGGQKGHRWPTRKRVSEHERFEGAFVMEPKRLGAIDNVHVADFAGLYPSIIRSWNMSPETRVMYKDGAVDLDPAIPRSTMPRGGAFRLDVKGMFPTALDTLVAERAFYSKAQAAEPAGTPEHDRYKRLSAAYKVVANSFYGIIGSPFSRYYVRSVAESVTTTAQWLIQHCISASSRAGLEAFYGDTDALYVTGDEAAFKAVVDGLNEKWPVVLKSEFGVQTSYVKLEFEKSFRRFIIVTAKRYAGSLSRYKGKDASPDAKPMVVGLEYKRGDAAHLTRSMQHELITMLLRPELPSADELREWVLGWRVRVMEGDLAVRDVTIAKSVTKKLEDYAEKWTTTTCRNLLRAGDYIKGRRQVKGVPCGFEFREPSGPISTHVTKESPTKCGRCGTERKITKQGPHIRIAKMLAARGAQIGEGTKVRYCHVVPLESGGEDVAPIEDVTDPSRIDRTVCWSGVVYPPSQRVLEAVYRREDWNRLAKAETKRVADLPLFSGVVPTVKKRRGAIVESPLFARVASSEPVGVRVATSGLDERDVKRLVEAVRACLLTAPGLQPVILHVATAEDAVVRVAVPNLLVERAAAELALSRLGAERISLLPVGV